MGLAINKEKIIIQKKINHVTRRARSTRRSNPYSFPRFLPILANTQNTDAVFFKHTILFPSKAVSWVLVIMSSFLRRVAMSVF